MTKLYHVTVAEDARWNNQRVSGRHFSKHAPVEINETDMNDEILNSPLLDVVEVKAETEAPKTESKATKKGKAE